MTERTKFLIFALWVLLIPLPLFYPLFQVDYGYYYYQFSSFSLYPHFVCAVLILLGGRSAFRQADLFRPIGLTVPLLILTLATAVSILYSTVDGRLAAITLSRLIIALLLYFVLKSGWLNRNHFYVAFLIFLTVQGVVATMQFWLQDDLGLSWLGELDLAPEPGRGSIIFGQGEYWLRSYGLAPHPNIMGGFVGSALLIVTFGHQQIEGRGGQLLAYLALFFGTLSLCFSFSRSAWLGSATGLILGLVFSLLLFFQNNSQPDSVFARFRRFVELNIATMMPIILAVLVFILAARDPLQARSQPQENEVVTQSVGERQILISVAFDFIEESFPFGVGAGNFGPTMLFHPDKESFPNIHPVHNVPILLTAELGLVGGATWIWLMLFPAGFGFFLWWRGTLTLWMIGLIGALAVLAVTDLFDYYSWGWPHGLTWRWMLFALFSHACLNQQ